MKKQSGGRREWLKSIRTWLGGAGSKPRKQKPRRSRPTLEALEDRTMPTVKVTFPDLPTWQKIGSAPMTGGQAVLAGNNPVSGAIQVVVSAPNSSNIVYVGAASGGIWRIDNIIATGGPAWSYKTTNEAVQSISAIAVNPTDPNKVIAGLGTFSDAGVSGYPNGLLLSPNANDANPTWTKVFAPFQGNAVTAIVWETFTQGGSTINRIWVATGEPYSYACPSPPTPRSAPANNCMDGG
jgi:hypothetical protein